MSRGMGVFVVGGPAMLAFGVYRLLTADGTWFMDRWFDGLLFSFIGACWLSGPVLMTVSSRRRRAREQRLFSTGARAQAVVTSVEATTVRVNMLPMVYVTVRVEPEGEPAFTHRERLLTPATAVPQPGDVVTVAYDRANPSDLAFETNTGFRAGFGSVWRLRKPVFTPIPTPAEREARLARLTRLHGEGVLTDAELARAKQLMAGDEAPTGGSPR